MPQLLNPLASERQVDTTPSRADGIPASLEEELRMYGCQVIQQAGILLKLPQVTMATAQVLLQRFFYVSSFKSFSLRDICSGALFLASKLEETPRRLRDFINVFDFLLQRARHDAKYNPGLRSRQLRAARRRSNSERESEGKDATAKDDTPLFYYAPMSYFSPSFYDAKDALVIAEMQLLKRLGFQLQVNLPYATMINYLQLLGIADSKSGIAQRAWSLLNDALQTPVYALFPPHVLAAASIYLASMTLDESEPLPLEPEPWWTLFDVARDDLRVVSSYILRLYDTNRAPEVDANVSKDWPTEDALLASGLASRVRDEHGGLIDLADKSAIREWLTVHGHPSLSLDTSRASSSAAASAGSTPLRAPPATQ